MPDKVDFEDAVVDAEETFTELDSYRLVHPNRLYTINTTMDDIVYELSQDFYYDEDIRAKAYEILKLINKAITSLEYIEQEIYLKT